VVRLTPMTQAEFEVFLEHDIRLYADEQLRAGYVSETGALHKSRQEHQALLTKGLKTRDHYLYTIQESEHGQALGAIWLRASLDSSRPIGFIFGLEIYEPFRRQGYAKQAMLQVEAMARDMGLKQLALHVFADNAAARSLYEDLGYTVTGLNLRKEL
jgi:ribosomal protein S18 acetylase RimI-like enzyme